MPNSKNLRLIRNLRIELMKYERRSLNYTRKITPKSKPTIAAAHLYHPLTDKAIGEHRLMTQEEVSQIVSQVIRQELRGQINRHGNYQNTRGR